MRRNPFKSKPKVEDPSPELMQEAYKYINQLMSQMKSKHDNDFDSVVHCIITIGNESGFDWK